MNDLKFAFRQLLKNPGFTAVAVATLAICLGANFTILTVVDAILFRSLPFVASERLAILLNSYPGAGVNRVPGSIPNYYERRGAIKAFAAVSIYRESSVIVGGGDNQRRAPTMHVSPEFFSTLGVPLAMGQPFNEEHLSAHADKVAILTDAFWRSHFNADPIVLGRAFDNDGVPVMVIGVLPPGFRFLSSSVQFFRPASHSPDERQPKNRHSGNWSMIARLAPKVGFDVAQREMDAFNKRQGETDPLGDMIRKTGYQTSVLSLRSEHVHQVQRILMLLQVGVGLLLVIGVVNLANLLLIRTNGRTQEIAVRCALGATRWQIARGLGVEVMLLVFLAGIFGMLLSVGGVRLLPMLGATQLPLGETIHFGLRHMTISLVIATMVGSLLAALLLGLNLRKKDFCSVRLTARNWNDRRPARLLQHGFVVTQVALAFTLLSSAGLLGTSLQRALEAPVGFSAAGVYSGRIAFPTSGYATKADRLAFVEQLLKTVRAMPGVRATAANDSLPFADGRNNKAIAAEGQDFSEALGLRAYPVAHVTSDYWQVMGIRLLHGQLLNERDQQNGTRSCVVDKTLADHYWPKGDAIGRRLTLGEKFKLENSSTVIGVVEQVQHSDVVEKGRGTVYQPYQTAAPDSFSLVVSSSASAEVITSMLRQAVSRCDPRMVIDDIRSIQSRIDDSLVTRRSPALLALLFGAVALLLASLGTYGVLAYAVGQRKREIGVRMALGALPGQIVALFLSYGAKLVLFGLSVGIAGAWIAGRAMQSVLFGVGSFSLSIIFIVCLTLGGIVSLAIFLPSRRAARVEPMEILRHE